MKAIIWTVCILASMSASAVADTIYTVTDLGSVDGTYAYNFGINSGGQVAGGDHLSHASLYSNGSIQNLGSLGGFTSWAYGVNDSGQVAGVAQNGSSKDRPFLYSNGSIRDLGTLGGTYGAANGINNAGQVVGYAAGSGDLYTHAFLYSNSSMQDLGTLGGNNSQASAINSNGHVTGWSQKGTIHAFLYSGGSMQDVGAFNGRPTYAYGINDSDEIVGYWSNSSNQSRAFLYSGGFHDLGTLGGKTSAAQGISNDGDVVGWSYTSDLNAPMHAFLYSDGLMQDLNSLISPTSGWVLKDASAINGTGQIVGYGKYGSNEYEAFLLTPVPEPSSMILLVSGLSALLLRRKK